ncbi:hypothetical protein C2E23DRAFT_85603 [Lenzites betulinus]|nr:hypothetical protein C2E23DRAFT_85603 [Lenzites betulinus]
MQRRTPRTPIPAPPLWAHCGCGAIPPCSQALLGRMHARSGIGEARADGGSRARGSVARFELRASSLPLSNAPRSDSALLRTHRNTSSAGGGFACAACVGLARRCRSCGEGEPREGRTHGYGTPGVWLAVAVVTWIPSMALDSDDTARLRVYGHETASERCPGFPWTTQSNVACRRPTATPAASEQVNEPLERVSTASSPTRTFAAKTKAKSRRRRVVLPAATVTSRRFRVKRTPRCARSLVWALAACTFQRGGTRASSFPEKARAPTSTAASRLAKAHA